MTTAKKRNKKPAAAATTTTTTATTVDESALPVWFVEGMDELLMDHGKHINFERLMKCMPNMVQQLKEGTVSIDQFGRAVLNAFIEQYNARSDHMGFDSIFLIITTHCCKPGPPIGEADTTELMFLKEFADGILCLFFQEYDDLRPLQNEAFCKAAIVALQWSLEKTCRTFSAQMDQKYFNDETGAFLRWCPLYGVSSAEKFADTVKAFDLREQLVLARNSMIEGGRVRKDARNAALAVVHFFEKKSWAQCWECGNKGQKLPRCCRCSVAQYCGQDCQRKAWRRHKAVCNTNKKWHGFHLESLRIINESHETGTRHGFDLNLKVDYSTTRYLMDAVLHPEYFGLPAAGPSMKYFYQNLEHIVRRDWWVWSETCTLNQFMEKCRSSSHGDHSEAIMGAVGEVCLLLSFDLHGYAASKNNGIVTSKTIEAIVKHHPSAMNNKRMPVAFFLKIYLDYNDEEDLQSRQRLLNVIKAQGLAMLRENENCARVE